MVRVVGIGLAGLLLADGGWTLSTPEPAAASVSSEPRAKAVPTERGRAGDPGPLESEPRDFEEELPPGTSDQSAVTDFSEEAVAGEVPPSGLAPSSAERTRTKDLKRVREVVERRTEATETFLLEDGSYVTDVSLVPKWYREGKGEWARVDIGVVEDPERKGGFRSEGAKWSVRFGSSADGVAYEIEGQSFTAKLVGVAEVMPERDEKDPDVVWYRQVWPGVDVSYRLSDAAVKEDFHVESLDALRAAGSFESEWTSAGRLVPDPMLDGGVRLDWDGDGTATPDQAGPRVSIEPVRVYNSTGEFVPAAKGIHGFDAAREETIGREDAANASTRRLSIGLDQAWVDSLTPEQFPIVVDPSVNISPASGGGWNSYSSQGNSIGSSQYPLLGDTNYGGVVDEWRFGVFYNYANVWASTPAARVRLSDLQFDTYQYPLPVGVFNNTPGSPFYAGNFPSSILPSAVGVCHASAWSYAGMWMGHDPAKCKNWGYAFMQPQYANLQGHPSATWVDTSQFMRPWVDAHANLSTFGVKIDTSPGYTFHAVAPTLRVWWDQQATAPTLLAPAADATVPTLTPTLSWNASTDPDAGQNPPVYEAVLLGNKPQLSSTDTYELSGCTLGATVLWKSTFASGTSVQVPAGILNDGVTYHWVVNAIGAGGIDRYPRCSDVRKFTVNRRLGASGPFPMEQLGPVGVNLINGNVVLGAGSHGYTTVGGAQSVSLAYNSQATQDHGLRGRYYGGVWPLSGLDPVNWLQGSMIANRLDPTIDFGWSGGSPVATMESMDNFSVRWTGYVTAPTAGIYCFAGAFDDGVRIIINGVTVLNQWLDQAMTYDCSTTAIQASTVTFAAGETKSIVVEYYDHKLGATAALRVTPPGGSPMPVPTSWLSPDLNVTGPGWTMSAAGVAIQGALKTDTGVTLRTADGSTTEYKKSDTGAYVGPAGDGTVVRVDAATGGVSVLDDAGTSYQFSASGELQSAVTATDDRYPAATQYHWSGAPVKLTGMVDPVTGNTTTIRYGGDGACPAVPGGFTTAPSKLCSVTTPDGNDTKFFYDSSARLSRIVQPGGSTTDFAYDASNRIIQVRDPLAFDAVNAAVRADGAGVRWVIAYDGSGRASAVTAPAPTAGATQQVSTVTYPTAATGQSSGQWGDTRISVLGASEPSGFSKKVRFDDTYRSREVTDAAGFVSQTVYDGVSDRVSYSDTMVGTAAAMRSSTIYDTSVVFNGLSRPVVQYGPAPVGLFQSNSPNLAAGAASQVPTTMTGYDGGINGLAASWFDDSAVAGWSPKPSFVGAPKAHSLVGGAANWSWGSGSPDPAIPADNWSGRLTGLVYLPSTGTWRFAVSGDDGARLVVDDILMGDAWNSGGVAALSANYTLTAGWHRVTLEFREDGGAAGTNIWWWKPGGPGWEFVPAANLKPDLGLVTATADNRPSGLTPPNSTITAGAQLFAGAERKAQNGAATLVMQGDGNLVLYGQTGVLWATWTQGNPGAFANLDMSGNLIIYGPGLSVLWQSATWPGTSPAPYLTVQDDGNFVGYRTGIGGAYWATMTFSPPAPTPPAWVTNTTAYADPIGGKPTSNTVDAGGLSLTSTTGYEARGTANQFMRRTSRTLAAGASSTNTYTYYGAAETPAAPTCAGTGVTVTPVAQRGLAKTSRAADPTTSGGTGGIVREQIADSSGRTVASRVSTDTKWSCVAYDSRGRTTKTTFPASAAGTPAGERTVTNTYSIGADPFLSSVSDPAGTITTRVDLLGRVTDTKDTLGVVTHTDYDLAGRPTLVTVFTAANAIIERSGPTYNATGTGVNRLALQRWSNAAGTVSGYNHTTLTPTVTFAAPGSWTTLATPHYDTLGRVDYTDYASGVRTTNGFDSFNRPVSVAHTKGATTIYTDVITRDLHGRVIDRTVNGTDPRAGNPNYVYDNAGRLTDWWERDAQGGANVSGNYRFTYSGSNFANTCTGISGVNADAGKNSNRAEASVTTTSGTVTSVYCYDFADRIRKVTPSSGVNPYAAGFAYDAHGNTTTVGAETWGFDGANRHLKTAAGATTVEYTRDAADRIVTRSVNGSVVAKFAYTGAGDTSDITLDAAGAVTEITIGLTGGGMYTWRPSSNTVWSHGNTHGDLVVTANGSGTQTGQTQSFDPFGNPLGAATGIDNSAGDLDYGWHGQAQRPLEHQTGVMPTIEMGARPYQSALGRFFAVDPIEGGTPNDYLYVTDPNNTRDLSGLSASSSCRGGADEAACRALAERAYDSCSAGCGRLRSANKRRMCFEGCMNVFKTALAACSRLRPPPPVTLPRGHAPGVPVSSWPLWNNFRPTPIPIRPEPAWWMIPLVIIFFVAADLAGA